MPNVNVESQRTCLYAKLQQLETTKSTLGIELNTLLPKMDHCFPVNNLITFKVPDNWFQFLHALHLYFFLFKALDLNQVAINLTKQARYPKPVRNKLTNKLC